MLTYALTAISDTHLHLYTAVPEGIIMYGAVRAGNVYRYSLHRR